MRFMRYRSLAFSFAVATFTSACSAGHSGSTPALPGSSTTAGAARSLAGTASAPQSEASDTERADSGSGADRGNDANERDGEGREGGSGGLGGRSLLGGGKIKHVIVVIMENRTVDNLFNGFPGADTVSTGRTHDGKTVALRPTPFEAPCDPDHSHNAWVKNWDNGKMDGFDTTPASCGVTSPDPLYPYGYVPRAQTQPYFTLAQQFTFADRMFAQQTGPSYTGHLFLVAGDVHHQTDDPTGFIWGCDAPPGVTVPTTDDARPSHITGAEYPCFDTPTLGDAVEAAGKDWRYYSFLLDYRATGRKSAAATLPYDAINHIRNGPDWSTKIVGPGTRIFDDIRNGTLKDVSWVNPPIIATDHAQDTTSLGPDYNALLAAQLENSRYWNDTALFIVWDDHGGWYDHVNPPQLDAYGLGFRVPLIVVSKYAKRGYVSHVQHTFGSILKFTERTIGLRSLGGTDTRADDLADCFEFNSPKLKPAAIGGLRVGLPFFYQLPLDNGPADY